MNFVIFSMCSIEVCFFVSNFYYRLWHLRDVSETKKIQLSLLNSGLQLVYHIFQILFVDRTNHKYEFINYLIYRILGFQGASCPIFYFNCEHFFFVHTWLNKNKQKSSRILEKKSRIFKS